MPTSAPTFAPPVAVALPAIRLDNPPGSVIFTGYVTFPPGTNISYHYEYSCTNPFSNATSSPDVIMTATGGVDVTQVNRGGYV